MEQSVTKRVAKNSFWLFAGRSIGKLIEFITFVYLARVLAALGFGLFSFAQAILIYLFLLMDGGLSFLGIREVAKEKDSIARVGINIFSLRFILASLIFVLSITTLVFLKINLEFKLLLAFTFLLVFPRAFASEWIFQSLERMEFVGFSRVLEQLFFFVFVLAMIRSMNDLLTVPLLQFFGSLVSTFIFLFILMKYFVSLNLKDLQPQKWWPYFLSAIPLGISSVFIQIYYNLDIIMLGFMQRAEVVGWYSAAYKLFFVFLGTMGVFFVAVFPIACKKFEENKDEAKHFLEKYLRLMFLWAIPITFLGLICAETAMRLIYGMNYVHGALALKILFFSILAFAISGVYGSLVLIPAGRNKEFMYSVSIGAFINLVLNFILIPRFSLVGAAVATLITEIVVVFGFFYWARLEIQLEWGKYIIKPALACVFSLAGTFLILNWFHLADLPFLLGSALIFSGLYALFIVLTNERKFLFEFAREIMRG